MPNAVIGTPGKTTIFNTIWVNERVKDELPAELIEYLILHEHGHASRSVAVRLKFLVLTVGLAVTTVALLFLTMIVGTTAVFNPMYSLVQGAIVVIIGLVFATFAATGYRQVRWNEELRAERNALRGLGPAEYRRRHDQFERLRNRGIIEQLKRRLFYPTVDEVVGRENPQ
ncbi:hypothetical protein [Haloarcula nitratireducens]|uniref:Peptidase M48 domain-containing protein n=1 Tax=Haloarcula nitratireducens TaxID=2487749 RepID=A0AAW4PF41_9EURY|nr:hypothetical protein [Halomicroarcula nitratireducens]MBX0296991.1 hypothetical protein [Halomicroarcula nitratireducens]